MISKPTQKSPYPRRLCFSSGSWGHERQLKFFQGSLYYGWFLDPLEQRVKFTPTAEQWIPFWDKIDVAGVWNWERYYENTEILDGGQWSLIIARGSQMVFTEGSNAYPGVEGIEYSDSSSYGRFIQAIRQLTDDQKLFLA